MNVNYKKDTNGSISLGVESTKAQTNEGNNTQRIITFYPLLILGLIL
jgi:hypothetical protein